ncbi:hypothetical protein M2152_001288 [Microbacteriaceae bacterium SG_E_30_P1]|uniref:Uncharacterized protein n=1 Tax=Antiquaquibacter oligotrophicus TaxID=2880260 RepID=A0ABT6KMV3_9MICO|nr:hypothetical protein [Antiquaquibacter oligotrophicus]MDH6181106.1 hypothetical protein [Antiquaquibacter oligotrophicus]UDF13196.1 hypothetical protein LH407_13710 [Antiquaquibacter oligotrophicus]
MHITLVETTTQVVVSATTPLMTDFTMVVGQRTARIKKATVSWGYRDGSWRIDSVRVWGPVIRKSDGAESSQHVNELTKPAGIDGSAYSVLTPPEIVDIALANTPDWVPVISQTDYPRSTRVRSSL